MFANNGIGGRNISRPMKSLRVSQQRGSRLGWGHRQWHCRVSISRFLFFEGSTSKRACGRSNGKISSQSAAVSFSAPPTRSLRARRKGGSRKEWGHSRRHCCSSRLIIVPLFEGSTSKVSS